MTQTPQAKVAIITRTKNRDVLLERTIRTVLGQTELDWHHVIVNDGGSSNIVDDLISRFANQYHGRCSVIHNERSVGMEAASNIGIKASSSKYIVVLDDDDTWNPNFLTRSIDKLECETWPDTKGVFCFTTIIRETIQNGVAVEVDRIEFNNWLGEQIDLFTLLAWNRFTPVSFLFEREALHSVGLFDESLPVCGDWEFNIRFLAKFEVAVVTEALAYWHQRPSVSGAYSNSVIGDSDLHRLYRSRLINRWVRQSFASGSLNLGDAFGLALILEQQKAVDGLHREIRNIRKRRILQRIGRASKRAYRKIFNDGAL